MELPADITSLLDNLDTATLGHKTKTKTCFTGGWTCNRVGWSGVCLFVCFFLIYISGSKMTLKMTQKTQKFILKTQKLGKYFLTYFKHFWQKFSDFGKKQLILQDFEKIKKTKQNNNLPKRKIWVGRARKRVFCFSSPPPSLI